MRLIPAIDLQGGRCVRLLRGDFAAVTNYDIAPSDLIAECRALGVAWVHVVDLDGARDGELGNGGLIERMAANPGLELQVGGGLRSTAAVERMFDCGAARLVIGSAAVLEPDRVLGWLHRFGPRRIALAFDVRLNDRGTPCVATHGWQRQSELTLWDAVQRYDSGALEHVLCTDVQRDGALSGPNLDLYAEAVRRCPRIQWQASGGIRDAADLHALARLGLSAAISGKALLERRISREDLQPFLPNA